jgi:2'-hydroxyisoflavone reductase
VELKILVLGGTKFLGRHLVDIARTRGHEVTLFNRGRGNPDLYPDLEKLKGDRDGDLDELKGRKWDAVIDTSGYVPRVVSLSIEQLANSVEHYTFISSISAYADFSQTNMDESYPLGSLIDDSVEEVNGDTYGPLKAKCEQMAEGMMQGRLLLIRPGLIVGPYDPTDRFTYWPSRIAQGGEVLSPGESNRQIQMIDARDLATWVVQMIEKKKIGTYNVTGPEHILTMEQLLEECKSTLESNASITWVNEEFLAAKEIKPWIELPLWIPSTTNWPGFLAVNCRKAISEGLTFRPLSETIRDTYEWGKSRPDDQELKAGMTREREIKLLQDWNDQES